MFLDEERQLDVRALLACECEAALGGRRLGAECTVVPHREHQRAINTPISMAVTRQKLPPGGVKYRP